jgi:hypothetical protein
MTRGQMVRQRIDRIEAELEAAEREAIKAEKPLHNIAHAKC